MKKRVLFLSAMFLASAPAFANDSGTVGITVIVPDMQSVVVAQQSGAIGGNMALSSQSAPMVRMPNQFTGKSSFDVFMTAGFPMRVSVDSKGGEYSQIALNRPQMSSLNSRNKYHFQIATRAHSRMQVSKSLVVVSIE